MPRSRLLAHIRLTRLPLVATTVADVWAGWFGAEALGHAPAGGLRALLLVHASAALLYLAGMTLNDAFDAERDRERHPMRPIPSGLVSRGAAFAQGGALLGLGLGAALAAGWAHARVAALIAGLVLLYDGLAKRWAIPAALTMGAIRYLDVQLGAGFAAGPLFLPALVLGTYVTLLTYVSTFEERPDRPAALRAATLAIAFVLCAGGFAMPRYLLSVWYFAGAAGIATFAGMRAAHLRTREGVESLTLVLLLGMFAVNAGSLTGLGRWGLGLAALALAASFPLLVRALAALGRAAEPDQGRKEGPA